jgi:carbamoyltransferase
MRILGISANYHDSAAALVEAGKPVAAAQEERFTRIKHDASFPHNAVAYCLEEAGCGLGEIDHVVFYDKPFLKFERLLETYLATVPRGFGSFRMAMPLWAKEKLFQKKILRKELGKQVGASKWNGSLLFTEHHQSHAASAFFPSPFESAAVLTLDGVGEWCTTSIAHGVGRTLEIQHEIHFPHSLGLLYSAFTYYTGFKVNSGEYKLMGLAPYGEPRFAKTIMDNLIDLRDDGSFWLDQQYFNYSTGLTMTSNKFHDLFGAPPRKPESPLTQREMDLAASIQVVTEEAVVRLARFAQRSTGERRLCMAGGVALNCVANGRLLREQIFDEIWIQPAAGDAGGALGAALSGWHQHAGRQRPQVNGHLDHMQGSYLGPSFGDEAVRARLDAVGARYEAVGDEEVIPATADMLASGRAVGWMQGRMEFGPRALGARSILADPRSPAMQKTLNLKVKFRESFRPFAPSVLREDVSDWFDFDTDSPYMLLVADVAGRRRRTMTEAEAGLFGIDKLNVPRSEIPAVTHVDYSARVQTVHRETNPRYWALLSAFKQRTGSPVLVNTSFNVRGEPIVCTPEDAFRCFMGTGIEGLVIGNCILKKEQQDPSLQLDYKNQFELD